MLNYMNAEMENWRNIKIQKIEYKQKEEKDCRGRRINYFRHKYITYTMSSLFWIVQKIWMIRKNISNKTCSIERDILYSINSFPY